MLALQLLNGVDSIELEINALLEELATLQGTTPTTYKTTWNMILINGVDSVEVYIAYLEDLILNFPVESNNEIIFTVNDNSIYTKSYNFMDEQYVDPGAYAFKVTTTSPTNIGLVTVNWGDGNTETQIETSDFLHRYTTFNGTIYTITITADNPISGFNVVNGLSGETPGIPNTQGYKTAVFNTASIINLYKSMQFCRELIIIDISSCSNNVDNVVSMLQYCLTITDIDLSGLAADVVGGIVNTLGVFGSINKNSLINLSNANFNALCETLQVPVRTTTGTQGIGEVILTGATYPQLIFDDFFNAKWLITGA